MMRDHIRSLIRPYLLPKLHRWQHWRDIARGRWRQFSLRGVWLDFFDRRRVLAGATPVITDCCGIRFVLYPWDRERLLYLHRHPHDASDFVAIRQLVKPGNTVLDVGANIGFYAVFLSRLCEATGRVFAFEAVPDTFYQLRETLALNRSENVLPLQCAISELTGTAIMNLFEPKHSEWNTLGIPSMMTSDGTYASPVSSISVPSFSLDDFCRQQRIEHIHFLKIDVEGFELAVFRGATDLLRNGLVDFICFEISRQPLRGAGIESESLFEFLKDHGYRTYRFDLSARRFHGPIWETSEEWTNLYASRTDLSRLPSPSPAQP